jgi:RHS repeat-associated protein
MLYELTNQLTYRGYFYDFETGLYYLQSRYYAPNWGRFMNADKHFDTGTGLLGTNIYIYCDDNPIMKTDPTGEAGIPGSGATYTVYKAPFYVTTKKATSVYYNHTNKSEDKAESIYSGEVLEIIGGYDKMFTLYYCINGEKKLVFINKSDVKPYYELDNGTYFIRNVETGKYWDVKGAKTDNNTPVIQYDFHGGTNQQWKFTYGSDGFYRLSPVNAPSKALDITSAAWAKSNDKELKIYEYQTSGVTQQKWIVADSGHDYSGSSPVLRLITKESVFNANNEKCLEIGSGNKSNSKPVQTWDANKTDASNKKQQWAFENDTAAMRQLDHTMRDKVHALLSQSKYSQSQWNSDTLSNRKGTLKKFLADVQKILGTNMNAEIDYQKLDSNLYGQYQHGTQKMILNETLPDRKQLMVTIIHEARHRYQHECVDGINGHFIDSATKTAWTNNFNNYISSPYAAYIQQAVEWDAFNFAKSTGLSSYTPVYSGSW